MNLNDVNYYNTILDNLENIKINDFTDVIREVGERKINELEIYATVKSADGHVVPYRKNILIEEVLKPESKFKMKLVFFQNVFTDLVMIARNWKAPDQEEITEKHSSKEQ